MTTIWKLSQLVDCGLLCGRKPPCQKGLNRWMGHSLWQQNPQDLWSKPVRLLSMINSILTESATFEKPVGHDGQRVWWEGGNPNNGIKSINLTVGLLSGLPPRLTSCCCEYGQLSELLVLLSCVIGWLPSVLLYTRDKWGAVDYEPCWKRISGLDRSGSFAEVMTFSFEWICLS